MSKSSLKVRSVMTEISLVGFDDLGVWLLRYLFDVSCLSSGSMADLDFPE